MVVAAMLIAATLNDGRGSAGDEARAVLGVRSPFRGFCRLTRQPAGSDRGRTLVLVRRARLDDWLSTTFQKRSCLSTTRLRGCCARWLKACDGD